MEFITCIHELEQEGINPSYKNVIKGLWPQEWQDARDKVAFETAKWGLLRKRRNKINRRVFDSRLCMSFYIQLTPEKALRIIRDSGEIRRLRIKELEGALQKGQSDTARERIKRAISRLRYATSPAMPAERRPAKRLWLAVAGAALLVTGLAVFLTVRHQPAHPTPETVSSPVQPQAPTAASQVAIAVLTFEYMGEDQQMIHIADGITKEVIAAFSRFPDFWVTTPSYGRTYGERPVKVRKNGSGIGVQYVLSGKIRLSGDDVHISAQIRDRKTDDAFWAGNWNRRIERISEIRKDVTLDILVALQIRMGVGERARVLAGGTRNAVAYAKVMNAYSHLFENQPSAMLTGMFMARQLCEEAIALDPDYAAAHALLSETYLAESYHKNESGLLDRAEESIVHALALDGGDPFVRWAHARSCWTRGEQEDALKEAKTAVSINPDFVDIVNWYATLLARTGTPEKARELFERALKLPPHDGRQPYSANMTLGTIYLEKGEYDRAALCFEKALRLFPENYPCSVYLAASYAALGRMTAARQAAQRVLALAPEFTIEAFLAARTRHPLLPSIDSEIFSEQLHLAGLL